jgi:hypothetical protein
MPRRKPPSHGPTQIQPKHGICLKLRHDRDDCPKQTVDTFRRQSVHAPNTFSVLRGAVLSVTEGLIPAVLAPTGQSLFCRAKLNYRLLYALLSLLSPPFFHFSCQQDGKHWAVPIKI